MIGPLPDLSRLPSINSYAGLYLGVNLSCSLSIEADPPEFESCSNGIDKSESGRDEIESGSVVWAPVASMWFSERCEWASIRSAGFGNVLYVDPREVYLGIYSNSKIVGA